jgi:hypothetical protein
MSPVDPKIGVDREDFAGRVDFRQPHQTSIRQGHGPVAIAAHESPQVRLLVLDCESDANHAPLQQGEKRVGFVAFPFQQEGRFGKDRLAGEQWRPQALPLLDSPRMMLSPEARKLTNGPVSSRPGPLFTCQTLPCILD